jgi:hypothetical protein
VSTLIPKLQFLARSLYFSAPSAPHQTRTFFQDFARGEARFPLRAVEHFIAGARASVKAEDRLMLAEIIRGEILADSAPVDVAAIADRELQAQYEADVSLREWERRRCSTSREILIAKHTVHLNYVRELIDAHHRQ